VSFRSLLRKCCLFVFFYFLSESSEIFISVSYACCNLMFFLTFGRSIEYRSHRSQRVAGSQSMSTATIYTGAQINFGDLTPYLTYALQYLHWFQKGWLCNVHTVRCKTLKSLTRRSDSAAKAKKGLKCQSIQNLHNQNQPTRGRGDCATNISLKFSLNPRSSEN
jgi:hypothetical protein